LVRKQVPFREAHGLAGQAVALAETKGCSLKELTVADYKGIHAQFEEDVVQASDYIHTTSAHPSLVVFVFSNCAVCGPCRILCFTLLLVFERDFRCARIDYVCQNIETLQTWDFEHSVDQYTATGGTARVAVEEQIKSLRAMLEAA
jgi:argininosuccinate lyase